MKYFFLIFFVAACSPKTKTVYLEQPDEPVDEIATIVNEENEYRTSLGLTTLTKGLSCTLSTFTSGHRIQSSIPGHSQISGITQITTFSFFGTFDQPNSPANSGLNILPNYLRNIYLNLFLVRCQGFLVVPESGFYVYDLSSDDGSVLYINGSKTVDNDNAHGIVTVSGFRHLKKGVHAFRLDYAQSGGGNQALILKMNGKLIDQNMFYY